jgi:hypothetical protein
MGKAKGGRPEVITRETANKVCEFIAEGRTLRQIERLPGMPSKPTILRWASCNDEDKAWFRDQYEGAIAIRLHGWADDTIDISDDGSNDWYEHEGIDKPDAENIARSRLRIETRKWHLTKLLPKVYGEKQTLEHTGKDGTPLTPVMNIITKAKK